MDVDCHVGMNSVILAQLIAHVVSCRCFAHFGGADVLDPAVLLGLQLDFSSVWGAAKEAAEELEIRGVTLDVV